MSAEDARRKKRYKHKCPALKHLLLIAILAFLSFFVALNLLKSPSIKPRAAANFYRKYPCEIILTFEIEDVHKKVDIIGHKNEGILIFTSKVYYPHLQNASVFLDDRQIKSNLTSLTMHRGTHTVTYKFDFPLRTFEALFANCADVTKVKFVDVNINKVESTRQMFANCKQLRAVEGIDQFHSIKVTDMGEMFAECEALTSVNVANFITSQVTSFEKMFYRCKSLTSINVSGFRTKNAINMNSMFSRCTALTSVDISRFTSSKCKNMGGMFYGCHSITSLDFSRFVTRQVECIGDIFYDCPNLRTVKIPIHRYALKIKNEVETGLNRNIKIVYNYDYDKIYES